MSSNPWPWNVLGIDGKPDDIKDVKRAYARQLKQINQATEADKFEALRQAYEAAQRYVTRPSQPEFRPPSVPEVPPVETATDHSDAEYVYPEPTQAQEPPHDPEAAKINEALALCRGLSAEMRSTDAEKGFIAILESSLMDDPQAARILKDHICTTLRQFEMKHQGGALDASVSFQVIQLMEQRFHWLSDVNASNRDFRWMPGVTDKMLERSGEKVKVITADRVQRTKKRPNFIWIIAVLPLVKVFAEMSAFNSDTVGIFLLWGMSGLVIMSLVAMVYAFAQRRLMPATALVFAMLLVGSFPLWLYAAATSPYGLPVFCAEVIIVVGFCIVAAKHRGALESKLQRFVGGLQRLLDRMAGKER